MTSGDQTWVIEPRHPGLSFRMKELWRHRHLLAYFGAQAVKRRYRRTVLGWLWLFIRPLFTVLAGALLFGRIFGVDSGPVPYFLFFLVGMTSWHLFDASLMWVTRSLEMNRRLLKKSYFPRLMLPIAQLAPGLVEFLIHCGLIVGVVIFFHIGDGRLHLALDVRLLAALAVAGLIILLALGLGLWTSVWGANARDVRFTLRYVMQFWFLATPVIYPLSLIPEEWRWLTAINPMAELVETFKWGILGVGNPNLTHLVLAIALITSVFISGLWYFSRFEAVSIDRL